MSLLGLIILVVVIVGVCAIAYIGCQAMGIVIPEWFKKILMIVLIVFVVIVAIKIIVGMI